MFTVIILLYVFSLGLFGEFFPLGFGLQFSLLGEFGSGVEESSSAGFK